MFSPHANRPQGKGLPLGSPDITPAAGSHALKRQAAARAHVFGQRNFFISLFTHHRKCLFGEIHNQSMQLNALGEKLREDWYDLPIRFPHVYLDLFVLMPNHLHGIVLLSKPQTPKPDPILWPASAEKKVSLDDILREFMFTTTHALSEIQGEFKKPVVAGGFRGG